jgi:hypothetical protein
MEWERGDLPPGRVMATFKTGGLRQLLETLAAEAAAAASATEVADTASATEVAHTGGAAASETWTPVV